MMLDFSMPYIDGPTCCRQVKDLLTSKGHSKKDLPFVCMLTAYQEKAFEDIAIQAQADLFLTKPIFKDHMHKLLIKVGLIE